MNVLYFFILAFFALLSCNPKPTKPQPATTSKTMPQPVKKQEKLPLYRPVYTSFEQRLVAGRLQDIQEADSTFRVELKYATADNFMGMVLYDSISHAFLQPEAARKLVAAQEKLKAKDPDFSLLVYDAARPNSVQHKMWKLVANTPKEIYVAPPGSGSLHNFGCAVDLTIVKNGVPLDMGTPYDFFGKKAQPRYNAYFLERGELTPQQVANRNLLRDVMTAAGFIPIDTEWWHFNAFSLPYAKEHYTIIQ